MALVSQMFSSNRVYAYYSDYVCLKSKYYVQSKLYIVTRKWLTSVKIVRIYTKKKEAFTQLKDQFSQ